MHLIPLPIVWMKNGNVLIANRPPVSRYLICNNLSFGRLLIESTRPTVIETFPADVSRQVSAIDKLSNLPTQAGVYLLKDQQQKIIYVGKAKNLRARVKSYFFTKSNNLKLQTLVKSVADIEVILTTNEIEALLLERTLIKHQKPKFNVLLRDDKEYPLLRVDLNEQWPRLEKVRRKQDD